MSSPAAHMRARVFQELRELGVTNIKEPENYHIVFEHNGHKVDFNTSNSWFKIDGVTSRGLNCMLDKIR